MRVVDLPAANHLVEYRLPRGIVAEGVERIPAEVEAAVAGFNVTLVLVGLALGELKTPAGEVPIEPLDAGYGVLLLLLVDFLLLLRHNSSWLILLQVEPLFPQRLFLFLHPSLRAGDAHSAQPLGHINPRL